MTTRTLRLTAALLVAAATASAQTGLATPKKAEVFLQRDDLTRLQAGTAASYARISPDGRRFAQLVFGETEKQFVFINDQQSPAYEAVVKDSLRFSPDSKRVGWGALREGKSIVVVDDVEYPAFNGSGEGFPIFSPDSRRFAYVAKKGEETAVVIDGKEAGTYEALMRGGITWSPVGSRFAYIVKDGDRLRVVVDGLASIKYRSVAGFTFCPAGTHFAYVVLSPGSASIVVDGNELVTAEAFVKDSLAFDDCSRLHAVALQGSKVSRVQVDVMPTIEPAASK